MSAVTRAFATYLTRTAAQTQQELSDSRASAAVEQRILNVENAVGPIGDKVDDGRLGKAIRACSKNAGTAASILSGELDLLTTLNYIRDAQTYKSTVDSAAAVIERLAVALQAAPDEKLVAGLPIHLKAALGDEDKREVAAMVRQRSLELV